MKGAQLAEVGKEIRGTRQALEAAASALEAAGAAFRALAFEAGDAERAAREKSIRAQDLAAKWGVGVNTIYDLVTQKHLRAFRVGTAVCVPLKEVASYERRRAT